MIPIEINAKLKEAKVHKTRDELIFFAHEEASSQFTRIIGFTSLLHIIVLTLCVFFVIQEPNAKNIQKLKVQTVTLSHEHIIVREEHEHIDTKPISPQEQEETPQYTLQDIPINDALQKDPPSLPNLIADNDVQPQEESAQEKSTPTNEPQREIASSQPKKNEVKKDTKVNKVDSSKDKKSPKPPAKKPQDTKQKATPKTDTKPAQAQKKKNTTSKTQNNKPAQKQPEDQKSTKEEQKRVEEEKNALIQSALSSLNRSGDKTSQKSSIQNKSESTPSQGPKNIGSLHAEQGLIAYASSQSQELLSYEATYLDELIRRLKLSLKLPEYGEVKVQVTVTKLGKVAKITVLSSRSAKNSTYIENSLRKVSFPPFGREFGNEQEHTFILNLSNELRY